MKYAWMVALALGMSLAVEAAKVGYERYQSIVDRQMFGPLPAGFDPSKPPDQVSAKEQRREEAELSKEQEQLKSAISFHMINVTPDGVTQVGFTDKADPKQPMSYLMKVGETKNGWTVKEADPVKATMTVVKGEIEVSLEIGGNSAGKGKDNGSAAKSGGPSVAFNRGSRRLNGASGDAGGGLRSRRRQRDEELKRSEADLEARRKEMEERQRQQEEKEKERAAEREEQRNQLLAIQEELRKNREAKAADKEKEGEGASEE